MPEAIHEEETGGTDAFAAQVEDVSAVSIRKLIDAGVHFGHQTNRWNPKMSPYIYGARNGIHIVDLDQTARYLQRTLNFVTNAVSRGGQLLFVGTKRQAQDVIVEEAVRAGQFHVTGRWLGGTLTNFRTIRNRLARLEELETLRSGDQLGTYSKKMQSALTREYRKMYRNLHGMRTMSRLPEVLVVIDPKKERNAVKEAQKLGITTVALIDTDSDPDSVDLPIPGNDDSIRSIELIAQQLADAVLEGRASTVGEMERQKAEVGDAQPVG
jgi:small subunit ribosomal protein S2